MKQAQVLAPHRGAGVTALINRVLQLLGRLHLPKGKDRELTQLPLANGELGASRVWRMWRHVRPLYKLQRRCRHAARHAPSPSVASSLSVKRCCGGYRAPPC